MEKEDPIARIDRQRAEKKGSKNVVTILGVLTGVLAIALAVVAIKDYKMVQELEQDKFDLEQRIIVLKSDFDNLQSDYDFINTQLDSSREEVAMLVDRIKKTEATNRKKMRQYEKELGTLRSIMKSYVVQIDSLNTANRRLADELSTSRKELAKKGPMTVYVRVKDPDGNLLLDGEGASFKLNGEAVAASASREVDYQGSEVDMIIYVNNIADYVKGIYTIEVFTNKSQLGSTELMLR